jgi:hypothetical protein
MEWWKPKINEEVTLRFTATPNQYKTNTFDEGKCPICDMADKYTKRKEQVMSFITRLGWETSPIGQAIIKSLDEKIELYSAKATPAPVVVTQPAPVPDVATKVSDKDIEAWKTMTPAEKLQWCKTNLGMSSLVSKIINRANNYSAIMGGNANVIPAQSSTIVGSGNHTFGDAKKVADPVVNPVSDIKAADIRESATKVDKADKIVSIKREPEKKAQLTTKFNLTVEYIRNEVMPTLHKYSLHEVDAFSALFAKFRKDPEYAVALTVLDRSVFKITPEIAVNMVVTLYDQGHLK